MCVCVYIYIYICCVCMYLGVGENLRVVFCPEVRKTCVNGVISACLVLLLGEGNSLKCSCLQ